MERVLAAPLSSGFDESAENVKWQDFDQVVRQHQKRVYRVIWLLVKDADVADTLTQECFLRAYQKRSGFRGECRQETWLLKIAINLVRDHRKNQRNWFWRQLIGCDDSEAASNFPSHLPSPERMLLDREQLRQVWQSMDVLSDQQRAIFLLRFAEELPLQEIGEILGLKIGTVKAQLFRATEKVRSTVKENYAIHQRIE